ASPVLSVLVPLTSPLFHLRPILWVLHALAALLVLPSTALLLQALALLFGFRWWWRRTESLPFLLTKAIDDSLATCSRHVTSVHPVCGQRCTTCLILACPPSEALKAFSLTLDFSVDTIHTNALAHHWIAGILLAGLLALAGHILWVQHALALAVAALRIKFR